MEDTRPQLDTWILVLKTYIYPQEFPQKVETQNTEMHDVTEPNTITRIQTHDERNNVQCNPDIRDPDIREIRYKRDFLGSQIRTCVTKTK